MQEINSQFEAIAQKVRSLTELIQKLQVTKDNLQTEKEQALEENIALHKKIEDLENKNINLQLLQKASDDEKAGTEVLRQKLDAFITEIDDCITRIKG